MRSGIVRYRVPCRRLFFELRLDLTLLNLFSTCTLYGYLECWACVTLQNNLLTGARKAPGTVTQTSISRSLYCSSCSTGVGFLHNVNCGTRNRECGMLQCN